MLPGVLFCLSAKFLPDLRGITSSDLTHEVTLFAKPIDLGPVVQNTIKLTQG